MDPVGINRGSVLFLRNRSLCANSDKAARDDSGQRCWIAPGLSGLGKGGRVGEARPEALHEKTFMWGVHFCPAISH
jgi:hypothetical protein